MIGHGPNTEVRIVGNQRDRWRPQLGSANAAQEKEKECGPQSLEILNPQLYVRSRPRGIELALDGFRFRVFPLRD